jgi:hypothetical protein
MLVSCKDRPGKVYQLSPGADYTKESSWILIGDTSELNNKVQEFIDSKGAPNGLASLNESGIIPSAQLPSLETHINNKSNPHEVNKAQVGLDNVDNTSDANKPISTATQNALNSKFNASDGNALK